jgi:Aromatic-ring-opening dioxygenase LigAB, LigA subunit
MSRYAVDKVMRCVIQQRPMKEALLADPATFLAGFELEPAELRALAERDFTALYAMGGHPFLLVTFIGSISPPDQRAANMLAYQRSLADLGYPDYGT